MNPYPQKPIDGQIGYSTLDIATLLGCKNSRILSKFDNYKSHDDLGMLIDERFEFRDETFMPDDDRRGRSRRVVYFNLYAAKILLLNYQSLGARKLLVKLFNWELENA